MRLVPVGASLFGTSRGTSTNQANSASSRILAASHPLPPKGGRVASAERSLLPQHQKRVGVPHGPRHNPSAPASEHVPVVVMRLGRAAGAAGAAAAAAAAPRQSPLVLVVMLLLRS